MTPAPDLPRLRRRAPSTLPVAVLQFGQGNFLRGFLGWMLQVYNDHCRSEQGGAGALGVVVVRPTSRSRAALLDTQDGLYTTVLRGLDAQGQLQTQIQRVDCVQRELDLAHHYADFLALARSPDLRFFVSNTTEAGIAVNSTDRLADAPPSSFPAKLTRWLWERYGHFNGDSARGIAVLPCELIEANGTALRAAVQHYAALWQLPSAFGTWLDAACAFGNTLVDRIVTGYPGEEIDALQAQLGYRDDFLVAGELYHLWAIQAPAWVAQALPLHQAGLNVQWVDDLAALRARKVAILNGAHTLLAAVARPLGLDSVRTALADADVAAFLLHTLHTEVLPSLPGPAPALQTYTSEVLRRFRNPYLHHALDAIALNMESKCLTRLWPALQSHQQRHGFWPAGLSFSLAVARHALQRTQQSTALLDARVAQSPGLESALQVACARIEAQGLRAALASTEWSTA